MTAEEQTQYDTMFKAADELRKDIEREQRQREVERELEELTGEQEERSGAGGGDRGELRGRADLLMDAFRGFLATGIPAGDGAEEFRNLAAGVNTEGGFLVMPETFVALLIKALDDEVVIRQLANVIPMTQSASIGIPTLDSDMSDADWTTELATGSEDTDLLVGKRIMRPNPMAKRIKVSQQLLRTAALSPERLVLQRMAYKFGVTQEKSYLLGNGVAKPLGLFVASNNGIPISRDVSEDNTATTITAKGLISAKYKLKQGYLANSNWLYHRDVVKEIAKLTDNEGQFLWRESVRDGEPDRLLGRPVRMSEFAPNTMAANQYVGLLGDFSHYWIIDSLIMQIQRLTELYAETNQIGFIGRYEGDGAPVLGEAFARVQLAA